MTRHQARRERRQAGRKAKKLQQKRESLAPLLSGSPDHPALEQEFSPELIAEANAARERIQRQTAAENRKQDVHKTHFWMLQTKAEHQELLNANLETPETHIPGPVERILAHIA